jgi:hypothetical protein
MSSAIISTDRRIRPAAGNAAGPSFSFQGNFNTGMYRPAINTIGFSANGVKIVEINEAGAQITGSLNVSGSVTASTFIGNLNGTASFATSASSAVSSSFTNNAELLNNTGSATFATTGSNTFDGAQTITGSLAGNVVPVTVASSTGSIDLNTGNFFTITLDSGSTTHFNVTNVKAGQTANILVNTNTDSTASFSTNIRQESGSLYIPSTSGSQDVLTLVSWDTSSAYLAHIKRMV